MKGLTIAAHPLFQLFHHVFNPGIITFAPTVQKLADIVTIGSRSILALDTRLLANLSETLSDFIPRHRASRPLLTASCQSAEPLPGLAFVSPFAWNSDPSNVTKSPRW
jgi:hypothetical protein